MAEHLVFVYGTLKRGFPNDIADIGDFPRRGRYRTVDAFPLVVGGEWRSPYLIPEPGRGHRVYGEVYEVDDAALEELDRFEGTHLPDGYYRGRLLVMAGEGGPPQDAWTYFKHRRAIKGICSGPMAEYEIDPAYVVPGLRSRPF